MPGQKVLLLLPLLVTLAAPTAAAAAAAAVAVAPGLEPRPQHHHVLSEAAKRLSASSMPMRSPKRAASSSTFARFLRGYAEPYHGLVGAASPAYGVHLGPTAPSKRANDTTGKQQAPATPAINPVNFGADPTATTDSTPAFRRAVAAALNSEHHGRPNMAKNIIDLGGVTIDLQGGDYIISEPIVIPSGYGNLHFTSGTVRAAPGFSGDRYLIEVGEDKNKCAAADPSQKSCSENLSFQDMMLDGQMKAAGGLVINATMGSVVGPDMFFIGHRRAGVMLNGGHEVMIQEAWFGQVYYDNSSKLDPSVCNGSVDIEINGNDHVVSDVICFSGQTGVLVNGGANLVEGVHTWNDATAHGGHGIVALEAKSLRLDAVYLDYTSLLLGDPKHVSVSNSFFLGMGTVVLRAGTLGTVDGLILLANTWNNFNMPHNDTIVVDERNARFTFVSDLVMLGNVALKNKFTTRAVTVTKTLTLVQATRWEFNFTDSFVFPEHLPIKSATYSIEIDSGFPRHAMRKSTGHLVAVETDEPVNATVTVTASQSLFTNGNR